MERIPVNLKEAEKLGNKQISSVRKLKSWKELPVCLFLSILEEIELRKKYQKQKQYMAQYFLFLGIDQSSFQEVFYLTFTGIEPINKILENREIKRSFTFLIQWILNKLGFREELYENDPCEGIIKIINENFDTRISYKNLKIEKKNNLKLIVRKDKREIYIFHQNECHIKKKEPDKLIFSCGNVIKIKERILIEVIEKNYCMKCLNRYTLKCFDHIITALDLLKIKKIKQKEQKGCNIIEIFHLEVIFECGKINIKEFKPIKRKNNYFCQLCSRKFINDKQEFTKNMSVIWEILEKLEEEKIEENSLTKQKSITFCEILEEKGRTLKFSCGKEIKYNWIIKYFQKSPNFRCQYCENQFSEKSLIKFQQINDSIITKNKKNHHIKKCKKCKNSIKISNIIECCETCFFCEIKYIVQSGYPKCLSCQRIFNYQEIKELEYFSHLTQAYFKICKSCREWKNIEEFDEKICELKCVCNSCNKKRNKRANHRKKSCICEETLKTENINCQFQDCQSEGMLFQLCHDGHMICVTCLRRLENFIRCPFGDSEAIFLRNYNFELECCDRLNEIVIKHKDHFVHRSCIERERKCPICEKRVSSFE